MHSEFETGLGYIVRSGLKNKTKQSNNNNNKPVGHNGP
jgi:hypothetical protein